MNSLIFAYGLVCVVLTVSGARIDEYVGIRKKCLTENALQEGELSVSGSSTFLQNPKSKCYLKCFYENLDLFDAENFLKTDRAIGLIPENIREESRPLVIKCFGEHNNIDDKCEKSFAVTECFFKANPRIFQVLGILEPSKEA